VNGLISQINVSSSDKLYINQQRLCCSKEFMQKIKINDKN